MEFDLDLDHIQRKMFDAVRQPLTAGEGMRQRTREGKSLRAIANEIIKPNDRLTSFERLEIYNRQYWFRILSGFGGRFSRIARHHRRAPLRKAGHSLPAGLPIALVHVAQSRLTAGRVAARTS